MPKGNRLYDLDFNLYYATDRLELVKTFPLEKLRQSDLELIANYIMWGKDEDGTSIVDRKEVQIDTKYKSWNKRHEALSIEELRWGNDENNETARFDVGAYQCFSKIYKKPRVTLNTEKAKLVPGMEDLWKQIDFYTALVNSGKLGRNAQYRIRHLIIELRTEQYKLYENYYETIHKKTDCMNFWRDECDEHFKFEVLPRGTVHGFNDDLFAHPRKTGISGRAIVQKENVRYFDFKNKQHLALLVQYYDEIAAQIEEKPDSPLWDFLGTFDAYVDMANLPDEWRFVLECRKKGRQNLETATLLNEKFGLNKSESSISMIFLQTLNYIMAAVEVNYDEWLCAGYDGAWQTCRVCGEEKIADTRFFAGLRTNQSGIRKICRHCERARRREKEHVEGKNSKPALRPY